MHINVGQTYATKTNFLCNIDDRNATLLSGIFACNNFISSYIFTKKLLDEFNSVLKYILSWCLFEKFKQNMTIFEIYSRNFKFCYYENDLWYSEKRSYINKVKKSCPRKFWIYFTLQTNCQENHTCYKVSFQKYCPIKGYNIWLPFIMSSKWNSYLLIYIGKRIKFHKMNFFFNILYSLL